MAELIPFERGEVLKDEKLIDKLNTFLDEISQKQKSLLNLAVEKEKLLNEELDKAGEERNYDLIEALQDELKTLDTLESQLLDTEIEGHNQLNALRERWIENMEIEEVKEEILMLKSLLDELEGESNEKS